MAAYTEPGPRLHFTSVQARTTHVIESELRQLTTLYLQCVAVKYLSG